MDIKTRRITETPELESPTDATNVLVEDGGKVKRVPAKELIPKMPEIPKQIQADLAENDETNPAHVKNRILWIEKKMVELPITGEWQEPDEGKFAFTITAPLGLEIGKTYVVNCNGTDYTVVGKDVSAFIAEIQPGVILGNASVMGGPDTGEPFAIVETTKESYVAGGFCGQFSTIDNANNVPFSIKHEVEIVHKLPMKFLPKGYPYTEEEVVEILAECQPEPGDDDGDGVHDCFVLYKPIGFVAGETYIVNWNGVEYTCIAADDNVMNVTGVAAEPFMLFDMHGANVVAIISNDGNYNDPVTISVKHKKKTVHPIDPELLPNGLQVGFLDVEICPETALTFIAEPESDGALFMATAPLAHVPVEDVTYTVTFAGETYKCVAKADDELTFIGNLAFFGGEDTGVPFLFLASEGMGIWVTNAGEITTDGGVRGVQPVPLAFECAPQPYTIDITNISIYNDDASSFSFTDEDKLVFEQQLRVAARIGMIKVKCVIVVEHADMLQPGNTGVVYANSEYILPMSIYRNKNEYRMTCMFENNIIYISYFSGELKAIARKVVLATEA